METLRKVCLVLQINSNTGKLGYKMKNHWLFRFPEALSHWLPTTPRLAKVHQPASTISNQQVSRLCLCWHIHSSQMVCLLSWSISSHSSRWRHRRRLQAGQSPEALWGPPVWSGSEGRNPGLKPIEHVCMNLHFETGDRVAAVARKCNLRALSRWRHQCCWGLWKHVVSYSQIWRLAFLVVFTSKHPLSSFLM